MNVAMHRLCIHRYTIDKRDIDTCSETESRSRVVCSCVYAESMSFYRYQSSPDFARVRDLEFSSSSTEYFTESAILRDWISQCVRAIQIKTRNSYGNLFRAFGKFHHGKIHTETKQELDENYITKG